ncbi:MAG: hypothetical protein A2046_03160 [Bacteroidetes bacterium GWA2_30_7]|nr:MAG: hypothetical protein A2046_03160 [Bacteroidetes bacterium GWA2_30_7]
MENKTEQIALLLDNTKCIGCRGCQTSCKQWNNLSSEKTEFFGGAGYQNPANLSGSTYTLVKFHEVVEDDKLKDWVFWKTQCQHCINPACASVCLVGAIQKSENGPVVWDDSKCIGCRYCMLSCPYNIPKFEWDSVMPQIRKCFLCFDRIEQGQIPSCAKTCPTEAIMYGTRNELIEIAEDRLSSQPDKYYQHIYGLNEVGGTLILNISSIPLEEMGYPKNLTTEPLASRTATSISSISPVVVGLGAALGLFAIITNRKNEIAKQKAKEVLK